MKSKEEKFCNGLGWSFDRTTIPLILDNKTEIEEYVLPRLSEKEMVLYNSIGDELLRLGFLKSIALDLSLHCSMLKKQYKEGNMEFVGQEEKEDGSFVATYKLIRVEEDEK